jgi:short-subunit dehydrogenase
MAREQLKGKNIVITGASGGIGAEIAKLCAASGANLILIARSIEKLKQLQTELQQKHQVRVDVSQRNYREN